VRVPSYPTSILVPAWRGEEPLTSMIVASVRRWRLSVMALKRR